MRRLEFAITIAAPAERCFDLARSIELHMESATGSGEQAVAGRTSGLIGMNEEVTWRARHFGVWQHFTSRITAFDRPRHFRDTMVRGAFRFFEHDHFFTPLPDHRTTMRDVLVFESPLGPLGRMVDRFILAGYLSRFLVARNRIIQQAAESDRPIPQ
jgi:ligand-binding SRPBCC domain-containing protein